METFNLRNGRKLVIEPCDFAESPREWDNLTKCIFFGNYKHLGDNHNFDFNQEFDSREDFIDRGEDIIKKHFDAVLVKAVHLYEHSGTSISTDYSGNYTCRWDSGTIGFVVITKEDLRTNFKWKVITQKRLNGVMDIINDIMDSEIDTLSDYIGGEIYQFSIEDENGNEEDSCGGFYGSDISKNGILDYVDAEDRELLLEQI
jgi:hypothetical protein